MKKKPGFPQCLSMSSVTLSTPASHPSAFISIENLQSWSKSHKLYIYFDRLKGKKNPHTYDISVCDNHIKVIGPVPRICLFLSV